MGNMATGIRGRAVAQTNRGGSASPAHWVKIGCPAAGPGRYRKPTPNPHRKGRDMRNDQAPTADRRWFTLNDTEWDALNDTLERPAVVKPRLHALLVEPTAFTAAE